MRKILAAVVLAACTQSPVPAAWAAQKAAVPAANAARAGGASVTVDDEHASAQRDRERLTGDWGGARSTLSARGVDLQLELTGFVQAMMSGTGDDTPEPGGRIDALLNFNTATLGLWRGSGFRTHVEAAFGDIPTFRAGAVLPMHGATMLPLGKRNDLVATSLYFTQHFGTTASLMLGKINVVDLLARDPFFGGWGIHRFDNIAFVAPPSGLVPAVLMGGLLTVAKAPWAYTVMVFDPDDKTAKYWDEHLFANGVNTQVGATWSGTMDDRPTNIGVTATYSTEDGADLSDALLPPELKGGTKNGSWGAGMQVGHLVARSKVVPGRGLGVYARAALSDGNPNFIRGPVIGGLAGHGMVASRPHDSFGVGCYFYNFSNDLQEALEPVIGVDDERGLELFYRLAIAR